MIVDRNAYRLFLGSVTDTDAALDQQLAAADAAVKSYCGRNFERATYVEYPVVGPDGRSILLREWPVRQITGFDANAVELGLWYSPTGYWGAPAGSFDAATKMVSGTDYALDPTLSVGRVWRIGGSWWGYSGSGYRSTARGGALKAVYVGGWDVATEVPADLKMEVFKAAAALRRTAKYGAGQVVQSEQLGQYRIAYGVIPQSALAAADLTAGNRVLDKYREPVMA